MLISRTKVASLIEATNGRFFGAVARSKDGKLRTYDARIGVKKFLKGGKNMVVGLDNSYVTIWDKKAGSYRTLNLDTVLTLTVDKTKYYVQG